MHESIISYLSCPNCNRSSFTLKKIHCLNNEILVGILTCTNCSIWYKIESGILDLLPLDLRRNDLYKKFSLLYGLEFNSIDKNLNDQQKHQQILFFKSEYESYEKNVVNAPYYRALNNLTFEKWLKLNFSILNPPILEIGCGTGRQTLFIIQNKIQTISTDISEEMTKVAQQKTSVAGLGNYVDYIVADAEKLPFQDNSFGGCICCATLHHLNNPEKVLFELSKKLKKMGLIYTIDPNDSSIRFIFDFLMKVWKLYNEEAADNPLINKKDLISWLNNAGIEYKIDHSTFLPPHIFLPLSDKIAIKLLKNSDNLFKKFPYSFKFSGIIISEGIKSR